MLRTYDTYGACSLLLFLYWDFSSFLYFSSARRLLFACNTFMDGMVAMRLGLGFCLFLHLSRPNLPRYVVDVSRNLFCFVQNCCVLSPYAFLIRFSILFFRHFEIVINVYFFCGYANKHPLMLPFSTLFHKISNPIDRQKKKKIVT